MSCPETLGLDEGILRSLSVLSTRSCSLSAVLACVTKCAVLLISRRGDLHVDFIVNVESLSVDGGGGGRFSLVIIVAVLVVGSIALTSRSTSMGSNKSIGRRADQSTRVMETFDNAPQ